MEYSTDSEQNDKRLAEMNRFMKDDRRGHDSEDFDFRPSQSSQAWMNSQKTTAESLDFEETESVMWRKVC